MASRAVNSFVSFYSPILGKLLSNKGIQLTPLELNSLLPISLLLNGASYYTNLFTVHSFCPGYGHIIFRESLAYIGDGLDQFVGL
jgi:hypothetical protein